jgi:nucleoid DNA-binding protein
MITVEEILSELLLKHSCVIIPKFGGFVAKQSSAKIDLERNLVIPPSKQLLFNKNLIANDGLLVNELSLKSNSSFQDCENRISHFVEEINLGLRKSKQFELFRIGTFHLDSEGNINFEQDRYFNFLLNAYGLASLQFISKVQVEKIEDEIEKEPTIISIDRGKRNLWKYVAAACLLPIAFYSFWIPAKTDVIQSGLISHHDFNPFYKQEKGSYKKKYLFLNEEIKAQSFEEKLNQQPNSYFANFRLNSKESITVKMAQERETEPILVKESRPELIKENLHLLHSNASKNYEYVLGCFANSTNAENLYAKLISSGFEVNKSFVGSLIRVSIGATSDLDSLQETISKANNLGYIGWILKK